MRESTSKEKILKSIRDALVNPMDQPYDDEVTKDRVYPKGEDFDEIVFAEALDKVSGQFVYNSNIDEFARNLKSYLQKERIDCLHCYDKMLQEILNNEGIFCYNSHDDYQDCKIGITDCEYLVARLGTAIMSSRQLSGRKGFIWPPVHLVVAWKSQLVYDLDQAFDLMKARYKDTGLPSMITLVTGPSRTADIEKTLVLGAHGPEKFVVFFIDQEK